MVNTDMLNQLSRSFLTVIQPSFTIYPAAWVPGSSARMSSTAPNLPALTASTSYSFYPYPLKSGPSTSLRGLAPPAQTPPQAGPSTNRQAEITKVARIRERAERRALVGLRPAGFAIGRESEDLDLEEMTLEDERVSLSSTSLALSYMGAREAVN